MIPIWKDYYITLGADSYYDFSVRTDGAVIYTGRAWMRPGEDSVKIKINNICADYIAVTLPSLSEGVTQMQCAKTFQVYVGNTLKASVDFYNDWSYDLDYDPATMPLADPVNRVADPRQWLFYSVLPGVNSVTAIITKSNGTTQSVTLPIYASGDFNGDFNNDFNIASTGTGGTAILDLSRYDAVRVQIGTMIYQVRAECKEYCVFYVNARGGWDSLVLEGYSTLRDDLVRYTMQTDYDNQDLSGRGRKDYAIEVTPAWTLRTGWLSDDESLRMHHLLNSPEVYLCELGTGRFTPVLLTDTENQRKTFKGNGGQVNLYQFNASLAQQRFRR